MEDNKELFTAEGFRKNSLEHHGVKGQKWGKRRYQNKDGSLTPLGYKHWGIGTGFKDKVSKAIETSKKNRERKSQERDARQAEKITKQAEKARKQLEENARKREIQELKNQAAATKRETKQLKNVERQIKKDERAAKKEAKDFKKTEKKKEELLKNDDLDEILKNKDIFSTAELNNIYMKKMAEKKVADMKPKTWSQKFADKFSVDNIANVAQKAQKMYNAYDTISTVVNKATGSTVLPELGYKAKEKAKEKEKEDRLKKLRTYTINDIEKNLADISTEELMDWNKRANVLNRYSPGSMMKDSATAKETKAYEDALGAIKKTAKESTDDVSKTIKDLKDARDAKAMAEATRAAEKTLAKAEKDFKRDLKKEEKAEKKAVKEEKRAADEETKRVAAEESAKEAAKEKARTDDYWKRVSDYASEIDAKTKAKAESSISKSTSTRTEDISSSSTTDSGKEAISRMFSSTGSKASKYAEAAKIREASAPEAPDYETMEFESALDRTPKKVKVRKVTKKKMDSVEKLFETFSDLPSDDIESESAQMERAIRESEEFIAAFNAASSASSLSKRDEYYLGLQMVQSMIK